MKNKKSFMRYLIPGFIFQSVVIGGGYGTGAEIKEYFLTQGFVGGLLGMIVTTAIWAVVCAVAFEFARTFKAYDYNSMMGTMVGPFKYLYEICYIVLLLIVLGVINATAGSMLNSLTGLNPWVGIIILSVGIAALVILGTEAIEKALSLWSYVLYAVYFVFMLICFSKFGSGISEAFSAGEVKSTWALMGAEYAFYNLGIVPAVLFTVRNCETRKEALVSGALAGVIGVLPALLLLVCIAGVPGTLEASTPVSVIFEAINMKWFFAIFEIVLFGTLIETGTGFIKAVTDRIEITIASKGKTTPDWVRPFTAVAMVLIGVGVAQFGLTGLIAKGYGTICWGFFLAMVVPLLTIGVYKIVKAGK